MVMWKTADQLWPPVQAKKIGNKWAGMLVWAGKDSTFTSATSTSKVVLQIDFLIGMGYLARLKFGFKNRHQSVKIKDTVR